MKNSYLLKLTLSLLLFFGALNNIKSQNLENFDKNNPFKINGNISIGSSAYDAFGIDSRRSPFSYFLSANTTFSIYGFSVPMSFTYRDSQSSLNNPFNRYAINPRWKWISLQAGNVRLNLNPYIFNGQVIKGGGVELTPGKFRFSAAYGNLENPLAQIDTLVGNIELLETYKRKALTLLTGFGNDKSYIEFNFLRAKDNPLITSPDELNEWVKAEENIALGSAFQVTLFKSFFIGANVAASAITLDQNSAIELIDSSSNNSLQQLDKLFTVNLSTRLEFAGDASVGLKFKNFGVSANYKRVDPHYKSLGIYYFQEDLENYTIKFNLTAWKNRLRFNGSGGVQRNNLNSLRSYTNKRQIANGTLSLIPSKWLVVSARYSNFQTDRTPGFINVSDTLRYAQTTNIKGGTIRVKLGKTYPSSITLNANAQQLVDVLSVLDEERNIDNYNGNISYNINIKPKKLILSTGLNYSENQFPDRNTQRYGLSLKLGKKLFENKWKINLGGSYHLNFLDFNQDGNTLSTKVSTSYKPSKAFSSQLNVSYLNRSRSENPFEELRITARVGYSFLTDFKSTSKPKKTN